MAKFSKQVENRLTVTGKVAAAAKTHTPDVAKVLAARAAEAQGPGTKATAEVFEIALGALTAILEGAASAHEAAELAYVAEQADDVVLRDQREKQTADLVTLMTRLRSNVEDALGPSGLKTYGLEGPTPRAPRTLATHVLNVATLMEKQPASVTTALGATFDTNAVVAAIRPKGEALDKVLEDLDREARELEAALGKRDKSIETWVEAYQGTATALEGAFRLGGRLDLAERVRPTSRTAAGEDPGPDVATVKGGETASTTAGDAKAGDPGAGKGTQ